MSGTSDALTPVLVGFAQHSERLGDADYGALSPVELAACASRAALADAGVAASEIDTVVGIRQFDFAGGFTAPALGRSDNFPRSVCDRIGADPAHALLSSIGGQSPQQMINEMCAAIAAQQSDGVLLFGAEATSTMRHFESEPSTGRPDFSEARGGELDDRGFGLEGMPINLLIPNGLNAAPSQFAILENSRRRRSGLSRDAYARQMGELFAPFSRIAANNPHAVAPKALTADELSIPTERNRAVADPYTRLLVSRNLVNQAAAVVIMSAGAARRCGVDSSRWVYLHAHADAVDKPMFNRNDMSRSRATELALSHALAAANIAVDELGLIDLYSCFPISVFAVTDYLGLDADDPRGLTVTGGLPFFGGPGNNYALHAVAEMCQRLRDEPGMFGLVGAAGGPFQKYSVGVYSTEPTPWLSPNILAAQHEWLDEPDVLAVQHGQGRATVETYTIKNSPHGPVGIIVGRFSTGERVVASSTDDRSIQMLRDYEPFGHSVLVAPSGEGNQFIV